MWVGADTDCLPYQSGAAQNYTGWTDAAFDAGCRSGDAATTEAGRVASYRQSARTFSEELPALKQQFLVSGTLRREDGVHARVLADEPPAATATALPATLEDAYIYRLARAGDPVRP